METILVNRIRDSARDFDRFAKEFERLARNQEVPSGKREGDHCD